MSTPKIRPSDYPFAGTPTTTPRTDAAYFTPGATMYSLAGEMKDIERELAAAKEAYDRVMSIHGTVLEDLAAEREQVRVLRSALERRHDEQSYYCQYVEDALAATKEDSR